jgi:hypothetical protein
LVSLNIDNNSISYLPSWILFMDRLERIMALGNPCYVGPLQDHSLSRLPSDHAQLPSQRLLDTVAFKIRDYLFHGGDWSGVQDLPSHLKEKVLGMPAYEKKTWTWMFVEHRIFSHDKRFLIETKNGPFGRRRPLLNWRLISDVPWEDTLLADISALE